MAGAVPPRERRLREGWQFREVYRSGSSYHGTLMTLEDLDTDGVLQEEIAALYGDSRADFLRKAVIGGSALLAALAAPARVQGEALARNDIRILQYALNFE